MPAHAQSDQTTGPPAPVRSYKLLTEDEDWSFLKGSMFARDFWDPIKYIPLGMVDGSYLVKIASLNRRRSPRGLGADR